MYSGISDYFTSFCDKISLINPNIVVHLIPPETFIILLKVGNCPYFRTKETRDRKLAEARYKYCISMYLREADKFRSGREIVAYFCIYTKRV